MNLLIVELKSEAIKERHWKQLMRQLSVNWNLNELTLGQVWDADLTKHEAAIRDLLLVAQGEMSIELYINGVKDYWSNYIIDLINYQQKTKLIRGWDDLFNKLKEHMNNLSQMKFSLYYKQFEEDALVFTTFYNFSFIN
jgi:dynein heavy chain 1